jgi:hypothetical protein
MEESNVEDIFFTICYNGKHIKEDSMRRICKTCVKDTLYYSGICGRKKKKFFLKKIYWEKVD